MVELEVFKTAGRSLGKIAVSDHATVKELKKEIANKFNIKIVRQSIQTGPKGKSEDDNTPIRNLNLEKPNQIYVKDLGPQIGWDTVFFWEYAGPIFLYALLLLLPHCFYGTESIKAQKAISDHSVPFFKAFPINNINQFCNSRVSYKIQDTAFYAGIFWTIHYGKRILETAFVHRFSHGTMPIFNLFKNSAYYWGFSLYIAYHISHPLHTPPPTWLFYLGSAIFIICELGNLSIHLLLRNLRPSGTNIRKIPLPNSNPLTKLFNYVSCPNYTYEFGSWVGFTLLTGCLPVFIFALAGLYQMSVWAIGKHKKYLKEFPNYPKRRKAILPFVI